MRCPVRIGRQYAERLRQLETEPPVVVRVAKQDDGGKVKGIGGSEHCMHECAADAAALETGQYAEGPKPE